MKKFKAIIVDEERLARVNLRRLLAPFPEIELAGEASSCAGALELINLHNPQLIFLDIQLHGESGFDLLELIDNSIKIIFVTAYDEYAIRSFDVHPGDYLLKPVNPQQLKKSIERVTNRETTQKSEAMRFEYFDSMENHSLMIISDRIEAIFSKMPHIILSDH